MVGLQNAQDQGVPNDVAGTECEYLNPSDVGEDALGLNQSRSLGARQIDLRNVAGDNDFLVVLS